MAQEKKCRVERRKRLSVGDIRWLVAQVIRLAYKAEGRLASSARKRSKAEKEEEKLLLDFTNRMMEHKAGRPLAVVKMKGKNSGLRIDPLKLKGVRFAEELAEVYRGVKSRKYSEAQTKSSVRSLLKKYQIHLKPPVFNKLLIDGQTISRVHRGPMQAALEKTAEVVGISVTSLRMARKLGLHDLPLTAEADQHEPGAIGIFKYFLREIMDATDEFVESTITAWTSQRRNRRGDS